MSLYYLGRSAFTTQRSLSLDQRTQCKNVIEKTGWLFKPAMVVPSIKAGRVLYLIQAFGVKKARTKER